MALTDNSGTQMRTALVERLSDPARSLLHEIETYSGVQVSFERVPHRVIAAISDTATCVSVEIGASAARIFLQPAGSVCEGDIVHELLHIKLKWLDGWPAVAAAPGSPNREALLGDVGIVLETFFEHAILHPQTYRLVAGAR